MGGKTTRFNTLEEWHNAALAAQKEFGADITISRHGFTEDRIESKVNGTDLYILSKFGTVMVGDSTVYSPALILAALPETGEGTSGLLDLHEEGAPLAKVSHFGQKARRYEKKHGPYQAIAGTTWPLAATRTKANPRCSSSTRTYTSSSG